MADNQEAVASWYDIVNSRTKSLSTITGNLNDLLTYCQKKYDKFESEEQDLRATLSALGIDVGESPLLSHDRLVSLAEDAVVAVRECGNGLRDNVHRARTESERIAPLERRFTDHMVHDLIVAYTRNW